MKAAWRCSSTSTAAASLKQQQVPAGGASSSAPTGGSAPETEGRAKPELVDRVLGLELAARADVARHERGEMARQFARHSGDVGSSEVTVALWTARIRDLARGFQDHRKNVHMIREMELMFHRRRRLLSYLRASDFEAYCYCVAKLGLRDVYAEIRADDRYPEGSVHGQPADGARVRRVRFAFHPENRQRKTSLWKRLRPKLIDEDPSLADLRIK
ncbi:hypothetical protein FOA52_014718 [Chlamydomonas sp. UWO 241]|nr:hypothetical protein FOA52_014718 [Chlamydomonas sp. UWO 241]